MLEVRNLTKEYRPKKGNPVKALDGVSLKFPQQGMVFILGKSGSGKSTLLNLLGGLDRYDSGEIIIKGKSSADFTQSDFDSYRNTYLGFIFQEYNILNEFNVASNIALALELQGTKATNEAVNKILDEVDLSGYGGRKPTELSGGQKQRVAIARALVKNPQIILADEPTGALDSNTGLQVFDTLKKLSRDKLVIVITHDRDFAEMYGDRVIELKDGKVISDIEKYSAEADKFSEGVSIVDEKIIQIKQGYRLTERDLELINSYLEKNDAIISLDQKTNGDMKRFARIGDDGAKESFRDTDESKIPQEDGNSFKLIKSRLPFKNSLKMGASSLKNKPFRLVLTIFLSLIAFTMFGLTDTLAAYNKHKATLTSLTDANVQGLAFVKEKTEEVDMGDYSYNSTSQINLTDEDVQKLNETSGLSFKPVYSLWGNASIYDRLKASKNDYYFIKEFGGILEADENYITNTLGYAYKGVLPAATDEVAISKYFYSCFANYGYSDGVTSAEASKITDETSFLALNPTISINSELFKITAVIDTKFDENHFKSLQGDSNEMQIMDYVMYSELQMTVQYGYHGVLFVKDGFLEDRDPTGKNAVGINLNSGNTYAYCNLSRNSSVFNINTERNVGFLYNTDDVKNNFAYRFFDENKTALNANEILLDVYSLVELRVTEINYMLNWQYDEETQEVVNYLQQYLWNSEYYDDLEFINNELMPYLDQYFILDYFKNAGFSWSLSLNGRYNENGVTVVGYFVRSGNGGYMAIPDENYDNIRSYFQGEYAFAIAPMPDRAGLKKAIDITYTYNDDGENFRMKNGVMSTITMLNDVIEIMADIFLYIGIAFALFSALMLTNFISTSVAYKKREIGILRAVGAKSSDVYGIFANESLIIALINFVLSALATGIVVTVLNSVFRNQYHLSITILSFGIRQIGIMLLICVAVALIASFIPSYKISRKKPVDAIRS